MSKRPPSSWLTLAKDYWWLGGVVIAVAGTITFLTTAPKRLEALEASDRTQQTTLDRITVLLEKQEQEDDVRRGPPWYDTDQHGVKRICHAEDGSDCWRHNLWQRVR